MSETNAGGRSHSLIGNRVGALQGDVSAVLAAIDRQRILLAQARERDDHAALLLCMTTLGHQLVMVGRAVEAAPLLDEALQIARANGDRKSEIEVLLRLGTARQYLGERKLAQLLFAEALMLCDETGSREQEHFVLHQRGCCHIEQGAISKARAALKKALAIRKTLGNQQFVDETQAILDQIAPSHN